MVLCLRSVEVVGVLWGNVLVMPSLLDTAISYNSARGKPSTASDSMLNEKHMC